ncbi:sugar transferase [Microbaculum marinum]|uniref:Sugar transferase n=1 Tax=Microbaculum marinum TaxID=1764581 RepID=A0AAW9RXA3_9HYPH
MPRHLGWRGAYRLLARNRYQLAGAILVAVVLPALIVSGFDVPPWLGSNGNTTVGTFAAILFGAYILRRMTTYPGVPGVTYVLPVFAVVFAAVIIVFFFLRFDYSRMQMIVSFGLALLWFSFVQIAERRLRRPHLLLLPFGRTGKLLETPQADWMVAREPDLPPEYINGVVADLGADLPRDWERFLASCALGGLPVYHSKQVSEMLSGTVQIEHLSENTLGSLLPSSIYLRFKRALDLLAVAAVAPLALAMAGACALAIVLEDGRPVLFRQQRMGFRGAVFTIFKFRTMRCGIPGKEYTEADDERITGVGRFLRRYRFDELPQIVNIFKGEMSWIGPRPEALALSEWYESQIPFYSYRHIVRPGITGWAQVHQGNVAEVMAATGKLHYDFYYIKYFSPWLDLLIAAKTVRTVLTGFGAR